MPPNCIWAVRGGSSTLSCGEKHSMRMTAVLTARADGIKLPIMFIIRGQPGGRIESSEIPTFPAGHFNADQGSVDGCPRVETLTTLSHTFRKSQSRSSMKIWDRTSVHYHQTRRQSASRWTLDVGAMAPFKRHLRELWLFEEMIEGDEEDPYSLTAQQKRMAMVKRAIAAWNMVLADAVRGGFEKPLASTNEE
ncbi:hypothetical protein H257_16454 [Aphanomyces astaci]|uniref:DDE-1 domain-containing protein n=1 Tax=Aphanomyces astaci TaxID=112090 RepID=W4FKK4_APHAT|nr:hypothetical protein H257_16454 [Aphanomyces astaci]ETV67369.1 hypothetical protein H257_16454 [Aphanomyces astaci]|eukprot:XP_009843184.1 hypothetical protein H257_16454 [Aphanomyces astaci]